jgi:hypothetical protein
MDTCICFQIQCVALYTSACVNLLSRLEPDVAVRVVGGGALQALETVSAVMTNLPVGHQAAVVTQAPPVEVERAFGAMAPADAGAAASHAAAAATEDGAGAAAAASALLKVGTSRLCRGDLPKIPCPDAGESAQNAAITPNHALIKYLYKHHMLPVPS